jgi:SRSO17 transposase
MKGSIGARFPIQETIGMDADTIMAIRPALTAYLHEFDDCMGRQSNRRHMATYVTGQLSDLDRKSVEPIADAAGVPPRTLQEFLSMLKWDDLAVIDRLQRRVRGRHSDPNSVGIIDETSYHKQGQKTACVKRQWCGARGKVENCVVSVQLGYAAGDFHTLLDGELFLPEHTWDDPARRREAGIPDDVVYRPKWVIAEELIQRALANGVRFGWLTFDEYYGRNGTFRRGLETLGQNYVAEIPVDLRGWTKPPQVHYQDHPRDRAAGTKGVRRRLKVRNAPAVEVRNLLKHSPVLRKVKWERFRVKDGEKGPMVVEAKRIPFWIKDEKGMPSGPYHLLIVRPVLHPAEVKFFLSNAAESTTVETLLLVAYSRWRIERMFEDSKTELGMDHFEVRKYPSILRHLVLTCVSHLFLAEFCLAHRGEKSGPDRVPGSNGDPAVGSALVPGRSLFPSACGIDRRAIGDNAAAQRRRPVQPSSSENRKIARHRNQAQRPAAMSLAPVIAL